jgi:hypothetical protein
MLSMISTTLLSISALVPMTGMAGTAPPDHITIEVVTVNGSGCPAGTALVEPAPDNRTFMVDYSAFLAQTGAGSRPTDFRKNCQISLRVNHPEGVTYGITQTDFRGFTHLETGSTGNQLALYYFQGMSARTKSSHSFSGPFSDNWQTVDKPNAGDVVYSPCGKKRNLNINAELRVNAGNSNPTTTSFMSMASTRGNLRAQYNLKWKPC